MSDEKINHGEWMYELREKWMNLCGTGRDIEHVEAKKSIEWLYAAGRLKKPAVVFADSPLSAYYAAVALLCREPGDLKDTDWLHQTYEYISSHTLSHLYDIWLSAVDKDMEWRWRRRSENRPDVWNFWRVVRRDIARRVFSCVLEENTVADAFEKLQYVKDGNSVASCSENVHVLRAWRDLERIMDSPWGVFYKMCRKLFCYPNYCYGMFAHLVESGMYDLILLDGVCILVPFPYCLRRDGRRRLHSEVGPALAWKDGYELNFLHGLHLEKELWAKITSRTLSPQEVLAIKNQEIRRVAIECYGYETIINAGANVISESEKGQVIEVDLSDDNVPARFVKVTCPSTGREFLLRVDPRNDQTKDVTGALAWTANMTPDDYVFLAET